MDDKRIFVIGSMGSDRRGVAEKIAAETGFDVIDLDSEIEKKENLTIRRLCMMMGEHAYRNNEYEMLVKLTGDSGQKEDSMPNMASGSVEESDHTSCSAEIRHTSYSTENRHTSCSAEVTDPVPNMASGSNDRKDAIQKGKDTIQKGIVVICGDGIIFDDMCVDILKREKVIVADFEKTADELWLHAKNDETIPYAFMLSPNENERYEKFCKMYETRKPLYQQFVKR